MPRSGTKGVRGFATLGPNTHERTHDGAVAIHLDKGGKATVDEADYPLVAPFRWYQDSGGYASCTHGPDGRPIRMHRVVMGILRGHTPRIDHADHNGLNNRRGNLRVVHGNSNQANMRKPSHGKQSRFKGVSGGRHGGWRAYIKIRPTQYNLGTHATEEQAARAYDAAAKALFGEFALLNFPEEPPTQEEVSMAFERVARGAK